MKAETINYLIPQSVKFTGKQMEAIRKEWCEKWNKKPSEFEGNATEEDILDVAATLGYITLPEGWKA